MPRQLITRDSKNFKAVIFDLDGTLLNTLDDLAASMNRVLQEKGFPTHPTEAFRYFVGEGAATLVSRALPPARRNDGLTADCMEAFRNEYDRNWNVKTRPYNGVGNCWMILPKNRLRWLCLQTRCSILLNFAFRSSFQPKNLR